MNYQLLTISYFLWKRIMQDCKMKMRNHDYWSRESIEAILPRRCLLTSSALDGRAWATKIPWIHQKKSKGEQSKKIHCLRDWNIMQMVEKNGNRPKVGTRKVVYVVCRYVCYHVDGKSWDFIDLIIALRILFRPQDFETISQFYF